MKAALTDRAIQAFRCPATGRLEIADLKCSGLEFRVTSSGARSWSFRYRCPISGKPARATIGHYPTVSLGKARARAEELRREVAEGVNPAQAKRQARAEADAKAFAALANRYLNEHALRRKRSADADERNLRKHILPCWGDKPYTAITRADVIALAENLVSAGKPTLANRVTALVSSIFSFAIDAGLMHANPCARLRKRGTERVKTRILSDDEIRLFWERCVEPPVSRIVGLALRLSLLTGMRAGEVAGLVRTEIEYIDDPERAAVVLPASRTKNSRPCLVPLSPLAADNLHEALMLTSNGDYIFAPRGGAIKGHALAVAMRRMAARLPGDHPGAGTWKANPPTPHDLRRTCATRLAALGAPGEDVSAVLNHVRADVTGRHYDHYARAREKRIALTTWATALARILEPGQGGEIVPLRKEWAR